MSLHYVIEKLTNRYNYDVVRFADNVLNQRLRDRDLEVWQDGNRYIVTKSYMSKAQLENWLHDQIIISFIYDFIPARFRNNLYFLLVIDFKNERNREMDWMITEIEKNDRVCRKYVVETREDLKRVPALNHNFMEVNQESIVFEKKFKNRLFRNKQIITEYEGVTENIKNLVELYFDIYDETEIIKEEKKELIEKAISLRSETD